MSEGANGGAIAPKQKNKAKGALALVSAGAVACGVCCALPFALPAVALAGSGGALAWIGGAQGVLAIVAGALVLLAWVWVGVTSARSKRRPANSTLIALSVVTFVLLVGLIVQVAPLASSSAMTVPAR